ncbi:hypothetical protein AMECASPLE_013561 [Ameca splendens]|uniref:Uncharacterized protein n=1 Tax=Ameca splendens TaxID=208324 RepID=A0ABV0XEM2_9TELE
MTRGLIHKKREQDGDVALQKVTSVRNRNKRKRSSTSNRGREEFRLIINSDLTDGGNPLEKHIECNPAHNFSCPQMFC